MMEQVHTGCLMHFENLVLVMHSISRRNDANRYTPFVSWFLKWMFRVSCFGFSTTTFHELSFPGTSIFPFLNHNDLRTWLSGNLDVFFLN